MSTTQTSFGMSHGDETTNLKELFDGMFHERENLETAVWSVGCTGSCICSLSCDDCSCGCA